MRQLENRKAQVTFLEPPSDVITWLRERAVAYEFLLAHCDGGVVWGRVDKDALVTHPGAERIFTMSMLQEARLFGAAAELHVWRVSGTKFRARELCDGRGDDFVQSYDEAYLLWGDHCEKQDNGFSLLADGAQGLRHWVPVTVSDRRSIASLRLSVRHYLRERKNGALQPAASRLVGMRCMSSDQSSEDRGS